MLANLSNATKPTNERRIYQDRREAFTLRAAWVIRQYLRDHPESELRMMVSEGVINSERAYRTLIQQARDPKTEVQRPDVLPYVLDYEMRTSREQGRPLTVGMYDLDDFKQINSELDHTGGDRILRQAGQIMLGLVRGDDVTRWGGEEFVMVYPNTSVQQALIPAERLRQKFEQELVGLRPQNQFVTISGGLVAYDPNRHTDWQGLLQAGSQAVLLAKAQGKNRILVADPT